MGKQTSPSRALAFALATLTETETPQALASASSRTRTLPYMTTTSAVPHPHASGSHSAPVSPCATVASASSVRESNAVPFATSSVPSAGVVLSFSHGPPPAAEAEAEASVVAPERCLAAGESALEVEVDVRPDGQSVSVGAGMSSTSSVYGSGREALRSYVSSLALLLSLFRALVPVSSRKYRLRTYHGVFVASEALDALVRSGALPSRPAALRLAERLFDAGAFYHVTREHMFKDKRLFFRYRDDAGEYGDEAPEYEAGYDAQVAARERAVLITEAQVASSPGTGALGSPLPSEMPCTRPFLALPLTLSTELETHLHLFESAIYVSQRKVPGQGMLSHVFVAGEAVTALVARGVVNTRLQGVAIGQRLLEAGVIHHVSFKHEFTDSLEFYRSTLLALTPLLDGWDERVAHYRASASPRQPEAQLEERHGADSPCADIASVWTMPLDGDLVAAGRVEDILDGSVQSLVEMDLDLKLLEKQFRAGVKVYKRKRYLLRAYNDVFVGSEAAEWLYAWLLKQGFYPTLEAAVLLGNELFHRRVFRHVVDDHPFRADELFYTFLSPSASAEQAKIIAARKPSVYIGPAAGGGDSFSRAGPPVQSPSPMGTAPMQEAPFPPRVASLYASVRDNSGEGVKFICPRLVCGGFAVSSLRRLAAHMQAMHILPPGNEPRVDFVAIHAADGSPFPRSGAHSALVFVVADVPGIVHCAASLDGSWSPQHLEVAAYQPAHVVFTSSSSFSKGDLVSSLLLSLDCGAAPSASISASIAIPSSPHSSPDADASSGISGSAVVTDIGSFRLTAHQPFS